MQVYIAPEMEIFKSIFKHDSKGETTLMEPQTLCIMKKQIKKQPVDFKAKAKKVKINKKELKKIKGGNVIEEDLML